MKKAELLMIPGPTPLPEPVREMMSRPAIGHRSAEFKEVLKRVFPSLQWIFGSKNQVFLYTASGTGAMEASMSNTLNPGDRVLALVNGVFSHRWAEIAKTLGLQVETLDVPPGEAHTPAMLQEYLEARRSTDYKAILLNHSETSTGVLSPIRELVAISRQTHPEALTIVDTITSLGATHFSLDDWDVDIAVSGSQKGFMLPPGLSFLGLSDRAWKAHQQCHQPGYYFNFTRYQKAQLESTTPYTPATPQILGLDVALTLMQEEGLANIIQRHARLSRMTRAGVQALGLSLFVSDPALASPSVTSFLPPAGLTVDAIRAGLKKRFGIVIADGQKELKGKIMRIGHLGHVSEREVLTTLSALEAVLLGLGHSVSPGTGVAAALQAAEASVELKQAVTHA
ncbi:pyridoxal-phosphate-dependent aminotransferase family protein [Vampirovibrio chlorellavorus]|uniref:pyridoxal-phosphate-dependent aminotransferase family protein n=1 Tax=Vampirovibrio chlorellavorus TaxID=758823 RepID=UPI0026EC568C|nr:alanine--glyoxylate aminotransferase family protein [Vampirovibrio chlorellavorus]